MAEWPRATRSHGGLPRSAKHQFSFRLHGEDHPNVRWATYTKLPCLVTQPVCQAFGSLFVALVEPGFLLLWMVILDRFDCVSDGIPAWHCDREGENECKIIFL